MRQIFKKEFLSYFSNYTAYICASAFVLICTLFLWFFDNEFNIYNIGTASLSSFFFIAPWILLFLIPALTMRTIAEEESSGTLQWLFTQPIKIYQIVCGKFFALLLVLIFCLLPTVLYIYSLDQLVVDTQDLDFGAIFSGYLGLFLLGTVFIAIGIFCSSMTKSQVTSYVLSIFFCFLLFYGFQSLSSFNLLGSADYVVQKLGAFIHYQQFLKGILDTRDLIYFLILITFFLSWTVFNVERKK